MTCERVRQAHEETPSAVERDERNCMKLCPFRHRQGKCLKMQCSRQSSHSSQDSYKWKVTMAPVSEFGISGAAQSCTSNLAVKRDWNQMLLSVILS